MKHYVLGFAFDRNGCVALIRKNKPEWQTGLMNGVGGKIEPGEDSFTAMQREFYEETGVRIATTDWQFVGSMYGPEWYVDVFTTSHDDVARATSITDEQVALIPIHRVQPLADQMIGNVPMLVQFCLLKDRPLLTLRYEGDH